MSSNNIFLNKNTIGMLNRVAITLFEMGLKIYLMFK
jgi:hypothetical protein